MTHKPKPCTIAPVPPEFAPLLTRADARAAGALAASGDVARGRYEDARAWTWELLARCGVAVERAEPVAAATPHDVLTDAAALFLAVPLGRDDCGFCRACTDALGVEKAARSYAHAGLRPLAACVAAVYAAEAAATGEFASRVEHYQRAAEGWL